MNITTKKNTTSTKVARCQPTSKTHRHALRGLSAHTGTRAGASGRVWGLEKRVKQLENELMVLYDALLSKGVLR
jgi:hypothetical protein